MKPKSQERGQALVIIALAVVGLFGFSALAIDGSRVFSDRRNAQNAADTAALSAALAKIRGTGTDYVTAAVDRAKSNGYVTDPALKSEVEVHICSDPAITTPCVGIPATAEEEALTDPDNYVQVKITSTIPATFARIVGRNEFTNIVTAIAYSGPVEPQPIVKGAALAALKEDGDKTLFGNGVVNLDVINSGVFNNSANNCGTTIAGAASTYTVDTSFQFVSGTYCSGAGNTPMDPVTDVSPIAYPPTFNIPDPKITCSGAGTRSGPDATNTITYTPGNYPSGDNLNHAGGVIFQPGNYCFGGNFSINGVANAIANNVKMKITKGEFSLNGISTLTCNNLFVHIDGGSGVRFNGSSKIECNDVTFFASTGDVSWGGNTTVRIFAPKGGDYKNLLIYMPYGNKSDLTLAGNVQSELTGSIIAVSSNIKITGVSNSTALHSQIIGYTVELKGSNTLKITYIPEEQWMEVDPSAIALTK